MSLKLIIVCVVYWLKGLFEDPVELFKLLDVKSSDKILEIGCAIGYYTFPLAQIAFSGKVYAVDIWEEGLAFIRRKIRPNQNIETICCSAEAVMLPPSSLDKVICFDALHDIPNFQHGVQKWIEFLKKGGKFYYRDPRVSPERIQTLSKGKFAQVKTMKGICIFIRQ
jgi:ubiquinone/menaquinone biosynthesis C-methylase UbiE